jgi:hypothetical protein
MSRGGNRGNGGESKRRGEKRRSEGRRGGKSRFLEESLKSVGALEKIAEILPGS